MTSPAAPLTEAEKEHFLTHGYIHLTNCFTKEQAAEKTKDVWTRLGMSPDDKSTWTKAQINMPSHWNFDAATIAPKAWAAICELCGGEDRLTEHSREWRDSFIVNLGTPEGEGKLVPPKKLVRWHVDGDFFVHYLDSPEQALLVVSLFTDIEPNAGGTVICPEAIPKIAKFLYDHPDGVSPHLSTRTEPNFSVVDFRHVVSRYNELVQDCEDFVEVTGNIGDIYLLHPLMMHSASHNTLRNARIITNPPVSLKEPHCFDRSDGKYSLVEKKTMQSVGGGDKLKGWEITMPRERIFPEMWKSKEAMKKEEIRRMEEAKRVSTSA
ncbi:hypothetical protein N431DRAFT_558656 [Stipitochalara longipes BDJ]|nr:hypothetical protein N431DRAFT_558656 [Stipitochalara longipes BDJ]